MQKGAFRAKSIKKKEFDSQKYPLDLTCPLLTAHVMSRILCPQVSAKVYCNIIAANTEVMSCACVP